MVLSKFMFLLDVVYSADYNNEVVEKVNEDTTDCVK